MLRVVVYINQTPVVDTHAVRVSPMSPAEGTVCSYQVDNVDEYIRSRYSRSSGAAKLAIKLLKRVIA